MTGLMMHAGGSKVTIEQLEGLPAPRQLGRFHRPLPHAEVVHAVLDGAAAVGLAVRGTEWGISKDASKLFGVVKFDGNGERARALGIRSSVDSSVAIRGVAGFSVFVCDNMALSGDDFLFSHKSTTQLHLINMVRNGLGRYEVQAAQLDARIEQMEQRMLADEEASLAIVKMIRKGAIPMTTVVEATHLYFDADEKTPDCQPRTVWGLHNAFTRAMRSMPIRPRLRATQALGAAFGI